MNQQWNSFKNKVIELQNKHIPHKSVRNEKNKGVIGLDLETLKVIKKKHRCWTRNLETKNGQLYQEYCKLRNKVRNLTRKVIKSKEKEIGKDYKDNLKKCWHYAKSRMKTCRGISDLVIKTENGKEVLTNNDDEKAETLSKFFSSVFTNEGDGDIPRLNTHDIKEKLGKLIVTEENV